MRDALGVAILRPRSWGSHCRIGEDGVADGVDIFAVDEEVVHIKRQVRIGGELGYSVRLGGERVGRTDSIFEGGMLDCCEI